MEPIGAPPPRSSGSATSEVTGVVGNIPNEGRKINEHLVSPAHYPGGSILQSGTGAMAGRDGLRESPLECIHGSIQKIESGTQFSRDEFQAIAATLFVQMQRLA